MSSENNNALKKPTTVLDAMMADFLMERGYDELANRIDPRNTVTDENSTSAGIDYRSNGVDAIEEKEEKKGLTEPISAQETRRLLKKCAGQDHVAHFGVQALAGFRARYSAKT